MRRLPWMAGVLAAALLFAGSASAATLSQVSTSDGIQVRYIADQGELNFVYPSIWEGKVSIQEGINYGTTPVTAVSPCEAQPYVPASSPHYDCPAAGVTSLYIDLGDQNDEITWGGMGPLGLPVTAKLGDGNDDIFSADHFPDTIDCGAGYDHIRADADDSLTGCERIEYPNDPAPSGSPDTTSWTRADGHPIGISINGGAAYTNEPRVLVNFFGPDSASSLLLDNDGGFVRGQTFSVFPALAAVQWTLSEAGTEKIPRTVYARFGGDGLDASRTFTDDIVLDETAPRIAAARVRGHTLRVSASDSASGVDVLQFRSAGGRLSAFRAFASSTQLHGHAPKAVRVRDRATNWSRWRPVRR